MSESNIEKLGQLLKQLSSEKPIPVVEERKFMEIPMDEYNELTSLFTQYHVKLSISEKMMHSLLSERDALESKLAEAQKEINHLKYKNIGMAFGVLSTPKRS